MSHDASVLSGSPASGKDAITEALSQSSPRYVHFEKFKAGAGRQAGYRLTTTADIDRMRGLGLILHANERYGNTYAVDRPSLDALFAQDLVPILHMGQLAGIRALKTYPAAWLSFLVWCPREVAEKRTRERGAPDLAARLAAWDETAQDLERADLGDFSLRIRTDWQTPTEIAEAIRAQLEEAAPDAQPAQVR
jgi:guanylate kinase